MKKVIPKLFMVVAIIVLLWSVRQALFGQLTGTFQSHAVPNDYIKLEQFLSSKNQFFRTLWVPTTQVFGFFTPVHPEVNAYNFFHVASPSGVLDMLRDTDTKKILQESGIKYVIVPYDSEGTIFLKDRKYDNVAYEETIQSVVGISWLTQVPGFERIHVFEVPSPKNHFWSPDIGISISYRIVSPVEYRLHVDHAKTGERIIFAESFDPYWQAILEEKTIVSTSYNGLNSFILPKNGSYDFSVYYKPQQWVNIGLWVSGITLGFILIYVLNWLQNRKNGRMGK